MVFILWPRSLSTHTLENELSSRRREHESAASVLVYNHVFASCLMPPSPLYHLRVQGSQGHHSHGSADVRVSMCIHAPTFENEDNFT